MAGGGAGATAKPEFRRAGSDKVGKWTCEKWEGFRNDEKVAEVCTVEPKTAERSERTDFQSAAGLSFFLPQGQDPNVGIATLETHGSADSRSERRSYGRASSIHQRSHRHPTQTFAASSYTYLRDFRSDRDSQ